MSFNIITTPRFEKSAKVLAKRHRSLKSDLSALIAHLENNPFQGVEITPGVRKIRLAICSKGKGKSGGARIITYTAIVSGNSGNVFLIDIYDKTDFASVDVSAIKTIISELDL